MERWRELANNVHLLKLLCWSFLCLALLSQTWALIDRLSPQPPDIAQLGSARYATVEGRPDHNVLNRYITSTEPSRP
jgi:hypothetical protein